MSSLDKKYRRHSSRGNRRRDHHGYESIGSTRVRVAFHQDRDESILRSLPDYVDKPESANTQSNHDVSYTEAILKDGESLTPRSRLISWATPTRP